jgi:hypothetical protein
LLSGTPRRGPERAFFLSAFAALHDPASRTYYDGKRAEGKETQRCPDLPGPPPLRRDVRHAEEQGALPNAHRNAERKGSMKKS